MEGPKIVVWGEGHNNSMIPSLLTGVSLERMLTIHCMAMDASSSTNCPSKQYLDVKVKNSSQIRAAENKLNRQPNGTVLRIYISEDVTGQLRETLRHQILQGGFTVLNKDPTKKDEEEAWGSS